MGEKKTWNLRYYNRRSRVPCPRTLREALEELDLMVRLLSIKDPFDGWRALTKEISKVWPEDVSAVDAIREQRDRPWNT